MGTPIEREVPRRFTHIGFIDSTTINTSAKKKQVVALIDGLPQTLVKCWIPCDHIPARSWALFKARDTLRGVIESLRQEARA